MTAYVITQPTSRAKPFTEHLVTVRSGACGGAADGPPHTHMCSHILKYSMHGCGSKHMYFEQQMPIWSCMLIC